MAENYYILFEKQLKKIETDIKTGSSKPGLLLHACCAPCSSHCLTVLEKYFDITVFFYNPNIDSAKEHNKRFEELERFVLEAGFSDGVKCVVSDYEPEKFYAMAKGRENLPERGERCYDCYKMRLEKSFEYASLNNYDYCTTTLSISPYKDAGWINEIGILLGEKYNNVTYLYSDFKKKKGYAHSIELSKEYNLYRQDYCGCVFSRVERDEKIKARNAAENKED